MAAGLVTPTEAGMGPSVLGIAASIGRKIRDAAQDAKEQREKAAEKGETPKKGSLFKSSLANQFNPIKSKKAKSNWAKQFDWNKKSDSDQQVKPPTGGGGDGAGKLKEFIAGGFTAILKDTGMMVSKLDGVKMMTGESLAEVTRSSSTLTVIKDSIDTQTELRRKALEEAKFARAEKKLEKTSDVAGLSDSKKPEDKGDGEGGGGDGGGPFDWILNLLGLGDLASNIPGKWLQKLNPFKKSPVTQGAGGKPPGPRMPGTSPRVTTSGGAAAPKMPGGFKMPGMPKGAGGVLGKLAAPLMVLDLYNTTKEVLNPDDNILTSLGDLGSSIFNVFQSDPNKKNLYDVRGEGPQADRARMFNQRILGEREKYNSNSEGGIVPLSRGGIAPGLYDNPTQGMLSPGQSVIPLNRSEGKEMFGKSAATSPGETAMDTVGAMILGVSAGMLGKTDSGTVGDQVKQNIRKASKEFGISNLTFTSSIGNAQFGKVSPNKDAKDFMMSLFDGLQIAGGKGKGKSGGGGSNTPNAGDVAGQAKSMVGNSAQEAEVYMDKMDEKLTAAGIPDAIPGSDKTKGDVVDSAWCAAYVSAILGDKGYKPPNSASADAYAPGKWGETIDPKEAKPGDVITFDYTGQKKEGWHVALVTGNDGQTITYVGGNQGSTGSSKTNKVTEGSISINDANLLGITRPKEKLSSSGNPQSADAQQTAQATQGLTAPAIASASEASLPDAQVTQVAQDGMVGKKEPAWWDIGGRINSWLDNASENATINGNKFGGNRYKQQMQDLGYASGGTSSRQKQNQENARKAREAAAKRKTASASAQRSRLGVQKVNGKWVNMGVSDQAVGSNSWWQVLNKKGATAERKAKQEALAKNLAERLNKQEAAKLKPKPAPARQPSSSGGTRPAPSSGGQSQSAAVVMPPASSMKAPTAQATGSFGSAVPGGKTSAMVFADFLYPDLV